MKSVKLSHVSLVVGLVLALTALWVGARPIGIGGDLVTGGWQTCSDPQTGDSFACTNGGGGPCQGTLTRYCYEYGGDCTGGTIQVAIDIPGQPGETMHAGGSRPCTSQYSDCNRIYNGSCY
jgi:hypothetical protein